jgi:uncharacterized protein (DUF433 family)
MQIGVENLGIGKGIYTISDLSVILKISKSRVRYWVSTYLRRDLPKITNFRYNFNPEEGIFMTFNSLLELYVFEKLKQKGHSRKRILESYYAISKFYNTKYPFTIKNIITAGNLILLDHEDKFISANKSFQLNLKEILKPYIEKIEFDEEGKAKRFYPSGKDKSVVIDPEIQFGAPTIKGTRINVANLVEEFESGDSIGTLAKIYNLREEEINDAIEFIQAA